MPSVSLITKYKKNTGILLSADEVLSLYLYGVEVLANNGTALSKEAVRFYIESSQRQLEDILQISFVRKLMQETPSFYRDDYYAKFPIFKVSKPVRKALAAVGLLNKIEQIVYPSEWLSVYKHNQGDIVKTIQLVPTGSSSTSGNYDVILTGITSYLGLQRYQKIPNYWTLQYETGFDIDKIPANLINVVGKLAAIEVLHIAGDLILGPGISSVSLSIDGLSQNIDSTSSATNSGYGARILNYRKEIDNTMKQIKYIYRRIEFTTL